MKQAALRVLALALLLIPGLVFAQSQLTQPVPTRPEDGRSVPATTDGATTNKQSAGTVGQQTGAVPPPTQAERIRKAEEAFQSQLVEIGQGLMDAERQIDSLRRQPETPPRWDIERLQQDISLLTKELAELPSTGTSALGMIQRNDLRDRLFELEVSLEIAMRRWGGGYSVFGADFFANAPALPSIEQRPAPAGYKLRIGDKLRIIVSSSLGQETEYHPEIDNSGRVYLPGAGSVTAAGKTSAQLQQVLANKIRSKFRQLQVTVAVESMATMLVQVTGEVVRPGGYTLTGMATVMSALYQAGGPTKSGSFRRIKLIRENEPARVIDLYDFLMNGSRKHDAPLNDGDLVLVPPVGGTVAIDGDVNRPARYEPDFPITLPAAIKMAGGAKSTGYLQTVQVERIVDSSYRVLVDEPFRSADGKPTFQIMPGDQITVRSVRPDKTNQVSVAGPVRQPGVYGLIEGMRVADLVKVAQGIDPAVEVYGGRADVLRMDPTTGRKIISVSLDRALKGDETQNIQLHKLDQVFLYEPDQVLFRPRLVTIRGAITNPGTYRRVDGMRISDAVAAAGGTLPEAYLKRADIIRHKADGSSELIRVDLQAAMSGDATANVLVEDRDELSISNYADVEWSSRTVRIEGAVQRPGVYARPDNMKVSDLVFAAGGLLPEASGTAEVSRCMEGGNSDIQKVGLTTLQNEAQGDLVLQDRDVVTVFALNPSLRSPEVVFITGEVKYPGPYTLHGRNEKLGDVIKRAGGLTTLADQRGALFLRQKESFENEQQGRDSDLILEKCRAFADKQFLMQMAKLGVTLPGQFIQAVQESAEKLAKPSEVVEEDKLSKNLNELATSETGTTGTIEMSAMEKGGITAPVESIVGRTTGTPTAQSIEAGKTSAIGPKLGESDLISQFGFQGRQELALLANSARISVDLGRALEDTGSADNIPLRQGDHIFIPRTTNVVQVYGAVLHPHSFAAGGQSGRSVDYYIDRSGGYAQDAAKSNVVVVRSNGDALPKDKVKTVEPGDTIVVPTTGLIDVAKKWERMGSVTKVISDVLSSVFVLTRF